MFGVSQFGASNFGVIGELNEIHYLQGSLIATSEMAGLMDRSIELIGTIQAESTLGGFLWFWDAPDNVTTIWTKTSDDVTYWTKKGW